MRGSKKLRATVMTKIEDDQSPAKPTFPAQQRQHRPGDEHRAGADDRQQIEQGDDGGDGGKRPHPQQPQTQTQLAEGDEEQQQVGAHQPQQGGGGKIFQARKARPQLLGDGEQEQLHHLGVVQRDKP